MRTEGGQNWRPITPPRGSILHAETHRFAQSFDQCNQILRVNSPCERQCLIPVLASEMTLGDGKEFIVLYDLPPNTAPDPEISPGSMDKQDLLPCTPLDDGKTGPRYVQKYWIGHSPKVCWLNSSHEIDAISRCNGIANSRGSESGHFPNPSDVSIPVENATENRPLTPNGGNALDHRPTLT